MFGGPAAPKTNQENVDREAVGSYALVHDLAEIGEKLFARPGQIVELGILCPACGKAELVGRANKYTRSHTLMCPNCTFRVAR